MDAGHLNRIEVGAKEAAWTKVDALLRACGVRLAVVPVSVAAPDELAVLPADQQALILRLARVLPAMPPEQRSFLADQVELWARRYAGPAPAIVAEPEPDLTAARGR